MIRTKANLAAALDRMGFNAADLAAGTRSELEEAVRWTDPASGELPEAEAWRWVEAKEREFSEAARRIADDAVRKLHEHGVFVAVGYFASDQDCKDALGDASATAARGNALAREVAALVSAELGGPDQVSYEFHEPGAPYEVARVVKDLADDPVDVSAWDGDPDDRGAYVLALVHPRRAYWFRVGADEHEQAVDAAFRFIRKNKAKHLVRDADARLLDLVRPGMPPRTVHVF
ncbi:hypothetical protein GMI70_02770 [Eggerthellaceae bacterium zg-893]|nr:hypothetical protein [Eggerthellaceae bacterium zg-893]